MEYNLARSGQNNKWSRIFGQKLLHCNFEFLESVYAQPVPPTLPTGETFKGMMLFITVKDKIVYARSAEQVISFTTSNCEIEEESSYLRRLWWLFGEFSG